MDSSNALPNRQAKDCLNTWHFVDTMPTMSKVDKSLDVHVKQLLDQRRGNWQAVAEGSGVSYSWLSKFARGTIDNPGYATLKRLAAYLESTGHKQPATHR